MNVSWDACMVSSLISWTKEGFMDSFLVADAALFRCNGIRRHNDEANRRQKCDLTRDERTPGWQWHPTLKNVFFYFFPCSGFKGSRYDCPCPPTYRMKTSPGGRSLTTPFVRQRWVNIMPENSWPIFGLASWLHYSGVLSRRPSSLNLRFEIRECVSARPDPGAKSSY